MTLNEYPELAQFIEASSAATIAVPIDASGTLHAATMLYWNSFEPFEFFFVTSRDSQKCALLSEQNATPCGVVIGTEKGTPFTLQMRGAIRIAPQAGFDAQLNSYYEKRNSRGDDIDDPGNCLLQFVPNWARFTDYSMGYDRHMLDLLAL
jgi:hypothetical protein